MTIKAVVWDIGGVLVKAPKTNYLWNGADGSKELRYLFGSGKVSIEEFVSKGSKLLRISVEEFLNKYEEIYSARELIQETFDIYKKFSNMNYLFADTNPIHLKNLRKNFPELSSNSVQSFMSSEIGYRKCDDESYKLITEKIECVSEEILFIDNTDWVLEKARQEGIQTSLYVGTEKLKEDLKKYDLIE